MVSTFKIPSKPLKCLILIKMINGSEQRKLLERIYKFLDSLDKSVSLGVYFKFLSEELIENLDDIFNHYSGLIKQELNDDTKKGIFTYLYKCITQLYAQYKVEIVCTASNNKNFYEQNKDDIVMLEGVGPVLKSAIPEFFEKDEENIKKIPKLTLDKINDLEKTLNKKIIGQKETISKFVNFIKLKESGLADFFSLLLVGKTGNGKTYTAETIANEYLNGRIIRIDCGTLTGGHEKSTFLGTPPGYVGFKPKSLLAEKADISNNWLILFDEIEKANSSFFDNLLGLMDTGKITDHTGNELDFTHSIFAFTSNEGMQYERKSEKVGFNTVTGQSDIIPQTKDEIMKNIKSKFRMEFINRLDVVEVLNDLSKLDALNIAKKELKKYPIKVSNNLANFVVDNSFSEEFGARNIKRYIKSTIGVPLAEALLNNLTPIKGKKFDVDLDKNNVQIRGNANVLQVANPGLTQALQAESGTDVTYCASGV